MAKTVLDPSLLTDASVQEWLKSQAGQAFEEEERTAAARKAAVTKAQEHADPQDLVDAMGIVAMGWSGDKESGTLQREALVVARCKSKRGRSSRKRKSGAQRRKAKKQGLTGASRRLAKKG